MKNKSVTWFREKWILDEKITIRKKENLSNVEKNLNEDKTTFLEDLCPFSNKAVVVV